VRCLTLPETAVGLLPSAFRSGGRNPGAPLRVTCVGGHKDLPAGGHQIVVMAITKRECLPVSNAATWLPDLREPATTRHRRAGWYCAW
jgi:hypothetical protein